MKIDTTKIENFDNLSAEEKVNALMNFEYEQEDAVKLKNALNKATSEASEYKKALREKQTEAERLEAERKEADAKREEELNALRKEKQISELKAKFMGVGYDKDLAQTSADALANGNLDDIFSGFSTFVENVKANVRDELLKKTPSPVGGNTDKGTLTRDELLKMSVADTVKFKAEHPEEYKKLMNK